MALQLQKTEEQKDKVQNLGTLASENFKFEENQMMTSYEGYWVRKSRVRFLNGMYHKFHRKIALNKELSSDDQKQVKLDRSMHKLLRNEHRMLKIELAKKQNKSGTKEGDNNIKERVIKELHHKKPKHLCGIENPERKKDYAIETKSVSNHDMTRMPKKKKPGKYLAINYKDDPDIVNYEGFYIYSSATKRLDKIKKKLTKKGMAAEEIRRELRKECRKAERLCKRGKKKQENSSN